jgi:hypothetical protein
LSYPAIKLHFTPPSKYYYLMQIQHQILLFGLIRISGALSVNDVIGLRALLLLVLFRLSLGLCVHESSPRFWVLGWMTKDWFLFDL